MESTITALLEYMRDVIYDSDKAALAVDELPEAFQDLGHGLKYFAECVIETKGLAFALSKGDLTVGLPQRGNEIAAPLKSLHASLKHLTWQAQQIEQGDYKQRVQFMGDFSIAFNKMVEQLAERERNLKETITQIQLKSTSLEQSNSLLSALMHYVPQQIIVIDKDTRELLHMNDVAKNELHADADYIEHLMETMAIHNALDHGCEVEFSYNSGEIERYFMVKTYLLEWDNRNAEIFAVSDISATKNKINELEKHAYRDSLTQLYSRTYGMMTLDSWLHEKRQFALVFADLDSLKYVNDVFGHNEGDIYIKNAAKHLQTFSRDSVVCRLGGDEFMLLAPEVNHNETVTIMDRIFEDLRNDEYAQDKEYEYSLSYGVAAIGRTNVLPASDILSMADEKMYENKRMRKKARQKSA